MELNNFKNEIFNFKIHDFTPKFLLGARASYLARFWSIMTLGEINEWLALKC